MGQPNQFRHLEMPVAQASEHRHNASRNDLRMREGFGVTGYGPLERSEHLPHLVKAFGSDAERRFLEARLIPGACLAQRKHLYTAVMPRADKRRRRRAVKANSLEDAPGLCANKHQLIIVHAPVWLGA